MGGWGGGYVRDRVRILKGPKELEFAGLDSREEGAGGERILVTIHHVAKYLKSLLRVGKILLIPWFQAIIS